MHYLSKSYFGMKLYMFRTVPLSITRSLPLYVQQWYMLYRFADSLQAGSGCNCSSILILLSSCQQTCTTYTIAVRTVKNSWWWTEELSETCRVSFFIFLYFKLDTLFFRLRTISAILFPLHVSGLTGPSSGGLNCTSSLWYSAPLQMSLSCGRWEKTFSTAARQRHLQRGRIP